MPESLPGRLLLRHRGCPRLLPTREDFIRRFGPRWQDLEFIHSPDDEVLMKVPYFFGYGSLVNRATHDYIDAHRAKISGWRRVWRHVEGRKVAFLTVVPDAACTIDGLIASVPNADWRTLDEREAWYKRDAVESVSHALGLGLEIQIYHAPAELHRPATVQHPLLLSYLDVVVQGYLTEFGEDGVGRFFDTTDGWAAPIRDDRAAPIYSRYTYLTQDERALVDHHLQRTGATFIAN